MQGPARAYINQLISTIGRKLTNGLIRTSRVYHRCIIDPLSRRPGLCESERWSDFGDASDSRIAEALMHEVDGTLS